VFFYDEQKHNLGVRIHILRRLFWWGIKYILGAYNDLACFCIDKMPQKSGASNSWSEQTFLLQATKIHGTPNPLLAPAGCKPLNPKHILGTLKLSIVMSTMFAPQWISLVLKLQNHNSKCLEPINSPSDDPF